MKNLFKKLLACCMAVCMVLTLCVGAITVGAEAATGTVTAGTVNITDADATAVVPVTAYAAGGIAAAEINVAVPENLSIAKLELATTDTKVEVTYASAADPSGAPEVLTAGATVSEVAPNVIDNVFTYIIHLPANTVTTAEVVVNITFAGTFAEGTIAVDVVDAEACYDSYADLIDLTITDGAIVVAVAHVHDYEAVVTAPTCTAGGYTTYTCKCEDSYVADYTEALGHAYNDGVVDPAPSCNDAGVKTFTCANCGDTYTEAVAALGHTPGEAKEENRVEAQPGVAGSYDMVVRCTVCDAVISSESFEIPALPEEIVPAPDENLQFRDIIVTVTSSVNIRYRVYANTTKGINGYKSLGYHDIEVVVYGSEYSYDSANLYNTVQLPEREIAKSSTNAGYNFLYEGISMISLGHKVFAYIKAYDAKGNYVAYSPVEEVSPEMLIKETIRTATTDNAKRTNIELLNMAAAAQEKFAADKAGTDLANDVAAGKLVNVGVDQDLAIKEMPELVAVDSDPVWEAGIDSAFQTAHKLSIAARLQQSPGIRVNVGGRTTLDRSKLRVDFVYYDPDPSVKTTVTKTVEGVAAVQNGARWAFDVPNLEFHNSNQTITAKVFYDVNDDGELELIGTLQYSIDASIKETIETSSSAKVIKLNEAIAKFGLAFRVNKNIATL